jgi:AraC-like DNA-binding protein
MDDMVCEHIYTGRLEVGPDYSCPLHGHPFHEILVVLSGANRLVVGGAVLRGTPGDVLFLPAGIPHREWCSATGLETFFTGVHWQGGTVPEQGLVRRDRRGRIRALNAWLYEEVRGGRATRSVLCRALTEAMLAEFVDLERSGEGDRVESVRAYAREHMDEDLTLDRLAAVADLSPAHLIRLYRGQLGTTPMADLRRMRVEAARHLILTTTLPLKAIAPLVGLAGEHHLSRLLRTCLGVGVRELRQVLR